MRLDPVSMKLFVGVVESGSIPAAAAREHVAGTAVSKRMGELEATLRRPLLERSYKGVTPTLAGSAAAARAQAAQGHRSELHRCLDAQRVHPVKFELPLQLDMEAAGVVEAVGSRVRHLKAGNRTAYATHPPGSYCDTRVMDAQNVCRLPDEISFETAAAMMLNFRGTAACRPGRTTNGRFRQRLPLDRQT